MRFGRFVSTVALLTAVALLPCNVSAMPVIDVAGLFQLGMQYLETLNQVDSVRRQAVALRQAAQSLDPRSLQSVRQLMQHNELSFEALLRDLNTIDFTVQGVNRNFRQLFPTEQAMRNMSPQQRAAVGRAMHQELRGSALAAARAQTSLSNIERNDREAQRILSASAGNESQVAQLEAAVQMLAVTHKNLAAIVRNVGAAGRVTSNMAASDVTARRLDRERRRRAMNGYRRAYRGGGIDRRFLQ